MNTAELEQSGCPILITQSSLDMRTAILLGVYKARHQEVLRVAMSANVFTSLLIARHMEFENLGGTPHILTCAGYLEILILQDAYPYKGDMGWGEDVDVEDVHILGHSGDAVCVVRVWHNNRD